MKHSCFLKFTLLVGLLMAAGGVSAAINRGNITGNVVDKLSSKPIPYAVVTLGLLPDTTVKKSVQTDASGSYVFNQVPDGSYVVTAHMVGYGRKHSSPLVCRQNAVTVETLAMENLVISGVTVYGKRPEIEVKADRTVVNVDNSATATSENAYEVLRKAPGINIDKDENISLKGKDGVMVTINDKPTYLSGAELASYLKTLSGTEIEKVELITTPPSRYEAAGNTGIINIKLKRNNLVGVNGSVNAGAGITHKVSEYGGLSLNLRRGKLNTFGSINGRYSQYKNSLDIERKLKGDTDTSLITQSSTSRGTSKGYSYRVGADYELNRRHTFGVMANGSVYESNSVQNVGTSLLLKDGMLAKSLASTTSRSGSYQNILLNANYKMAIDTNGRTLNVDADFVKYYNRATEFSDTYYFGSSGAEIAMPLLLQSHTPSDIYVKSFRADYVHPFSKTAIWEAGVKGSMVNSDNDLRYERSVDGSHSYVDDLSRSNHFKFDERIAAAYTSMAYDAGGWSLKGGLRAEHTWNRGNQVTTGAVNRSSYLDLFPSLFVQRRINEKNSLGVSYNRRIDRPSYGKLNPFVWRIDEYSYRGGSPDLRPQYSNNIEVSYSWNSRVFSSIGYSYTNDIQTQVAEEVDIVRPTGGSSPAKPIKAVMLIDRNLSSLKTINGNVSVNLNPVKWFRTSSSISASYKEYGRGGDQSGKSTFMYLLQSTSSFILPKQYTFEVSGWYRSPTVYGMMDLDPQYIVNVGVQKKFLNDRLSVKVSFDDVFHTMENKSWARYDNMDISFYNRWDSQRLNLSLSYRFGSKDVKQSRQRTIGADEEQKRMGN